LDEDQRSVQARAHSCFAREERYDNADGVNLAGEINAIGDATP
jgi:hypothetical protein